MSPFNYCPLVWMFCSKKAFKLLNKTHHKALNARFGNYQTSLEDLLDFSESINIHTQHLRALALEIYKTVNRLNPEIMWDAFKVKAPNKYELRRGSTLNVPKARTTRAINSFDFRAAMAWNQLPLSLKLAKDESEFKTLLKSEKVYCKCVNC